jgi:hypothetical protein
VGAADRSTRVVYAASVGGCPARDGIAGTGIAHELLLESDRPRSAALRTA